MYHGEVHVIFHFFVYVQFIFHCVLLQIVHAWVHWSSYWPCKCETRAHKSMCYCFLTRTKQPPTFPTICSYLCATATFKAGSQLLLTVQTANTNTSYSRWGHGATFWGQRTSYHALHVFLHMRKRLFQI